MMSQPGDVFLPLHFFALFPFQSSCQRWFSCRNALNPFLQFPKRLQQNHVIFFFFFNSPTHFLSPDSEKGCEVCPLASVSRWQVLFFSEKTSLLRVHSSRCVEKSRKISLGGLNSPSFFFFLKYFNFLPTGKRGGMIQNTLAKVIFSKG